MKTVKIRIEGIKPLLQHRFPLEDNPENKSRKKKKEYNAQEDAKKALYQDEKGKIYQPSTHILGTMIKAGTQFIYEGRKTYKDIIKTCIIIDPDCIPHIHQKWEVDRQPVVIQKARIMRARPRFDKWALEFTIEYDEEIVGKDKLKDILEYAGARIGIGDFRPMFGRFLISEFKEIKQK